MRPLITACMAAFTRATASPNNNNSPGTTPPPFNFLCGAVDPFHCFQPPPFSIRPPPPASRSRAGSTASSSSTSRSRAGSKTRDDPQRDRGATGGEGDGLDIGLLVAGIGASSGAPPRAAIAAPAGAAAVAAAPAATPSPPLAHIVDMPHRGGNHSAAGLAVAVACASLPHAVRLYSALCALAAVSASRCGQRRTALSYSFRRAVLLAREGEVDAACAAAARVAGGGVTGVVGCAAALLSIACARPRQGRGGAAPAHLLRIAAALLHPAARGSAVGAWAALCNSAAQPGQAQPSQRWPPDERGLCGALLALLVRLPAGGLGGVGLMSPLIPPPLLAPSLPLPAILALPARPLFSTAVCIVGADPLQLPLPPLGTSGHRTSPPPSPLLLPLLSRLLSPRPACGGKPAWLCVHVALGGLVELAGSLPSHVSVELTPLDAEEAAQFEAWDEASGGGGGVGLGWNGGSGTNRTGSVDKRGGGGRGGQFHCFPSR